MGRSLPGLLHVLGALGVVVSLAIPQGAAFAQEAPPASVETPAAAKGIRARVLLTRGTVLIGILPRGEYWEAPAGFDGYEAVAMTHPRAGLRLFNVQGIRSTMFIRKAEIEQLENLGPWEPEEPKEAPAPGSIEARRRALEDKERRNKDEMDRLLGRKPAPVEPPKEVVKNVAPPSKPKAAPATAPKGTASASSAAGAKAPAKVDPAEEKRRKEDALLERFPYPDWDERRAEEIAWRERVTDMKRTEEEAAFIAGLPLWKAALARRNAAAAAKTEPGGGAK